jgi:hypothetical protein
MGCQWTIHIVTPIEKPIKTDTIFVVKLLRTSLGAIIAIILTCEAGVHQAVSSRRGLRRAGFRRNDRFSNKMYSIAFADYKRNIAIYGLFRIINIKYLHV